MAAKNVLITGVTGFVGLYFAKSVLEQSLDNIYAPVRAIWGKEYHQREELASLQSDRFHFLEGNLANEFIVNNPESLPHIDEIWHIAGDTDFREARRSQIVAANVDGTRNVINLARKVKASKFFYVSTAYVSGIHEGLVREDELLPNPRFRNVYEESKYTAEKLVRESLLPFIIARPSIIMGHSVSGDVTSCKMVYGVVEICRILHELVKRDYRATGKIPTDLRYYMKGDQGVTKNLICIDDVVRLMNIIRVRGEIEATYHCCNSRYNTIGDLHSAIEKAFGMSYLTITPHFDETNSREQKIINKGVKVYEDYMTIHDPIFSLNNINKITNGDGHVTPLDDDKLCFLVEKYLQKICAERRDLPTGTMKR